MKRRDFFKWLPTIPIAAKALQEAEAPKPEVKPEPEPVKPAEPVRRQLGPQNFASTTWTVTVDWPPNVKPW